jgi:peptide/nickel transport system substrate-binding protein
MSNPTFLAARLLALLACLGIFGASATGCSSSTTKPSNEGKPATKAKSDDDKSASKPTTDDAAPEAFVLGNALKLFDPPPLEELDKLEWTDSPVLDSQAVLREEQTQQGEPEVTVEEALKLKNDSPENNRKILSALGRLAPADGAGVNYDAKMVRHGPGDLTSTNPLFYSSVTDGEFADLVTLVLTTVDRNLKPFASNELVESWKTSKDLLVDRFVIRDDLTWSDGAPFTAHDIEFTFKLIMSDHAELVIPAIRGSGVDQIKWIEAYDDRTLVVFHAEPFATNWGNLNFPIMPKHIYEKSVVEDPSLKRSKTHTELEEHPILAGPYEFVSRKRNEEFVVRRRESYYMHNGKQVRPKPNFAEVRVKTIEDMNTAMLAFKAGDVLQMELRAEHWESQTVDDAFYAKNTKVTAPEWSEFHIEWNQRTADGAKENPFFGDKRVRWAMTHAFDYEELLKTVLRGLCEQGQGTYHPQSWMFPKNPPALVKQDLDKAEDLLDEAGWTDTDGDGIRDKEIDGQVVPFEFQLMVGQTETGIQIATLMKECLEQIGIVANVKPTEFVVMQDKLLKHEFDACLGGWSAGSDPDSQINIYGKGAQRNYGQYSNPKVDELFQKGRRELDRGKRAEIYGQIHLQLWDDQPVTWLFYRPALFGFNKSLRGYNFGALGPFKYSPGFSTLYIPAAATP